MRKIEVIIIATFIAYATGHKSGQADFYDLATVSYARTIYINAGGGIQTHTWTIAGGATPSSSYVANFTNLTPSTIYTANCTVYRNSPWEVIYSNRDTFTTYAPPVSPWEWYTPKTSEGNFNLTAAEWLDFCERINQMRIARGLSSHPFTTTSNWISKDKPFYAWIFKQAVSALDGFWGLAEELKTIQSGNKIYAWYFNNLKSCLNQAIADIPK